MDYKLEDAIWNYGFRTGLTVGIIITWIAILIIKLVNHA